MIRPQKACGGAGRALRRHPLYSTAAPATQKKEKKNSQEHISSLALPQNAKLRQAPPQSACPHAMHPGHAFTVAHCAQTRPPTRSSSTPSAAAACAAATCST